jgi:hypothetical protein
MNLSWLSIEQTKYFTTIEEFLDYILQIFFPPS